MASNSSSCPTPGGGHLNGYPVPPYAFFFPHMLGGLSPPSTLAGIQHQLPVSGYSTPSPASEYRGPAAGWWDPQRRGGGVCVGETPLCAGMEWDVGADPQTAALPRRGGTGEGDTQPPRHPSLGSCVWGAAAPRPAGGERPVLLPARPR